MTEEKSSQRKKELKQELDRIVKILVERYKPEKIILFGSLVSGKIHEWSDIDLAIVKNTRKRFIDRGYEVALLTDPEIAIDFFVYTPEEFKEMQKNNYFIKEEMVKKGEVLYETGSAS